MHKTYDEKYITKVIKSSYICANSNINFNDQQEHIIIEKDVSE